MDIRLSKDDIELLLRQNRQARLRLTEGFPDPAAMPQCVLLSLHDLRDQADTLLAHLTPQPQPAAARTRGGQKQHYIQDTQARQAYTERLTHLFRQHYRPGRKFQLPDGTLLPAPRFLSLLYFVGIKQGLTTPEAPVRDFTDLVIEAAGRAQAPDFCTAYNTIQRQTRLCRDYVGASQVYNTHLHLHTIAPQRVLPEHRAQYQEDMRLMQLVEEMMGQLVLPVGPGKDGVAQFLG